MIGTGEAVTLEQELGEILPEQVEGALPEGGAETLIPEPGPAEGPGPDSEGEDEEEEATEEKITAALGGLTVGELAPNLLELGIAPKDILRAIENAHAKREETEVVRGGFRSAVTGLVMAYKSIGAKLPDDGQAAALSRSAYDVLDAATQGLDLLPRARRFGVPDPFQPDHTYTNPAAIVYTHGLLNSGQLTTPAEEESVAKFLEGAGVAPSTVQKYLRRIFTAHDDDNSWDEKGRRYDIRLNTLAGLGQLWGTTGPRRWRDILEGSVKPMYEELHR